ncbi:uncharacterized protein DMENIID0001_118290 [Sergentomyia squamirostris]
MSRLVCFLFVVICGASTTPNRRTGIQGIQSSIEIVENIEDYLQENHVSTLTKLNVVRTAEKISHQVGTRIYGDRLVAMETDSKTSSIPIDVALTLRYPSAGAMMPGAIVTLVDITVDQSVNVGNAYIKAGGIGQRYIEILVVAKNTMYFHYKAEIYGM